MLISDFGIRIGEDEFRDIVSSYLRNLGYLIDSEDIQLVPLTNNKVEILIRHFEEIKNVSCINNG